MMKSCGPVGMISHTSVRVISFIARASRSGHRVATLVRVVCEFPFSVEGAPTNGTAPAMESNYVRRVRRHLRRSCRRPDDLGFRRRRPVAGPSRCSPGNNDGNHAGRRGGVVCAAPILRTAASRPDLASGARHRNRLQPRGARGDADHPDNGVTRKFVRKHRQHRQHRRHRQRSGAFQTK
jgi:hypothetical protein